MENLPVTVGLSMKMQGYLLGHEVLQNGIVISSKKYDKPIPNLVVDAGKDAFFKYNDSLTTTNGVASTLYGYSRPSFGYYSSSNSGSLAYCGRGSGTTAAAASDTALEAQIGNLTNTFLSGDPNTGTRFDQENGKVIMRVTHDHEAESGSVNINELGWFGVQNSVQYMFSHIILPSTISLTAGQQLRTIYQLEITISPIASTSVAPTITGWTTDGDYQWECEFPATSTTFEAHGWTAFALFDTVATTGAVSTTGQLTQGYSDTMALLPFVEYVNTSQTRGYVVMLGSTATFQSFGTRRYSSFPTASSTLYVAFTSNPSSGDATYTTEDYVAGNFYRDRTLVFSPGWTGLSSIDIYAISLFGLTYIFDTAQTKSSTQQLTLTYRISLT